MIWELKGERYEIAVRATKSDMLAPFEGVATRKSGPGSYSVFGETRCKALHNLAQGLISNWQVGWLDPIVPFRKEAMTTEPSRLDELLGYPCYYWGYTCSEECHDHADDGGCKTQDIYLRHIALRKAVLGDMTPEEASHLYGAEAGRRGISSRRGRHFLELAKVAEGLADEVEGM